MAEVEFMFDPHPTDKQQFTVDGNTLFAVVLLYKLTEDGSEIFHRWTTSPLLKDIEDDGRRDQLKLDMERAIRTIRTQAEICGLDLEQ